ncbi:MAG: hypothetical protein VKJ09_15625 [Leptolyngbya sp.]|nr:hypothetical protein [Leptolyngbya sp.]
MGYRGANRKRAKNQTSDIFQDAGQTALWRRYVSAEVSTSAIFAGVAPSAYYVESVVTGVFGRGTVPYQGETQTPGGMVVSDSFTVTVREPLARGDELQWRGVTYRVESDPSPSTPNGTWVATLNQGE